MASHMTLISDKSTVHIQIVFFTQPRPETQANIFICPLTIETVMGIPGWHSGLAPAFGPGRNPGDLGSSPTSGSQGMEPASPSACVSASLSVTIIKKI